MKDFSIRREEYAGIGIDWLFTSNCLGEEIECDVLFQRFYKFLEEDVGWRMMAGKFELSPPLSPLPI